MPVRSRYRVAVETDTGLRRTNNEDRSLVDPDHGIYAVIDGVGGHAAGEQAADCAVEVLRERLSRPTGTAEERLREAIALANNEILERARSNPEWAGMACVLTVALIEDEIVTVGHVGDSRLYLLRPGEIVKKTRDHSPVGEREDRNELTEEEAMRHARRNEIYRDVGSMERGPDDPDFIDIIRFTMPPDGALLLCSDGLTDQIASPEVRAGIERYAPDFHTAVRSLIDAANAAGGKDNVTVVLVAGQEYAAAFEHPAETGAWAPAGAGAPNGGASYRAWMAAAIALMIGIGAGVGAVFAWRNWVNPSPRTVIAGAAGIGAALNQARPGDTVVVPDGSYREHVLLRQAVDLRAQHPGAVTLTSGDAKPAILARGIQSGSVSGLWIESDPSAPMSAGIEIDNASPSVENCRITGAITGVVIRGESAPAISSTQIVANLGAGVEISGPASPHITASIIAGNGVGKPGPAKPGVEVRDPAQPVFKDNAILDNAADPIWIFGRAWQPAAYGENFFGGDPDAKHVRVIEPAHPAEPHPAATHEPAGAHAARAIQESRR